MWAIGHFVQARPSYVTYAAAITSTVVAMVVTMVVSNNGSSPVDLQPNPWSSGRGSGGGGFGPKKREQESLLVAKVGAQDSSMRLLRADVTTLRRRLRAQGEVLAKQREENEVVRLAAEQVLFTASTPRHLKHTWHPLLSCVNVSGGNLLVAGLSLRQSA